jgi:hypothetical protein
MDRINKPAKRIYQETYVEFCRRIGITSPAKVAKAKVLDGEMFQGRA